MRRIGLSIWCRLSHDSWWATADSTRFYELRGDHLSVGGLLNGLTSSLLSLFKKLIADGVLAPGDRLPSERDLAAMMGVSRPSLRQALKVLENLGVISQRVGSGTRLNSATASFLSEPLQFLILLERITFHEMAEARLIMEPDLAAQAAVRATAEDLLALERAIVQMEESATDPERVVAADLAFHRALYQAARNRVCTVLFTVVHESLKEMVQFTSGMVEPKHTLEFHKRIVTAIRQRNPDAARQRMREHLQDVCVLLARGADTQTHRELEDRLKMSGPLRRNAG